MGGRGREKGGRGREGGEGRELKGREGVEGRELKGEKKKGTREEEGGEGREDITTNVLTYRHTNIYLLTHINAPKIHTDM